MQTVAQAQTSSPSSTSGTVSSRGSNASTFIDSTSSASDYSGGSPSSPQPAAALVHWELRALHHFTVCTSRTLPGSHIPRVFETWSVHVPRLAINFEPLLNALLALSTLHLIDSKADNHVDLTTIRAKYLNRALRLHRQSLEQLNHSTASAASFTSILLLINAFSMLRDRTGVMSPYEPPMEWMRIAQGTCQFFDIAGPIVCADSDSPCLTIFGTFSAMAWDSTQQTSTGSVKFQSEPYLAHLLQPGFTSSVVSVEDRAVFEQTIRYLQDIARAVDAGEHPLALARMLMALTWRSPTRLLDLVQTRNPQALILLSHYFALFARLRHLWWVEGIPEREVTNIRREVPTELRHFLDWPTEALLSTMTCPV